MDLPVYGNDMWLRIQLRLKIRTIKSDDQMILWEGVESLSLEELQQACAERGMRGIGLTQVGYRRQLKEWLDLSVNRKIPASLLIISRAFMIGSSKQQVRVRVRVRVRARACTT